MTKLLNPKQLTIIIKRKEISNKIKDQNAKKRRKIGTREKTHPYLKKIRERMKIIKQMSTTISEN